MEVIQANAKILTPSVLTLVGSTSSGKTTFVFELLKKNEQIFDTSYKEILYCYSCYQPLFDEMKKEIKNIDFYCGLPSENEIRDFADVNDHKIIILDDLMSKVMSSPVMLDLFCQFSHHLNITVFFLTQNIFHQGKYARTLNLNTHYFVLFRNRRDINQIGTFGRQLFPGKQLDFLNIYRDAIRKPFSYLFVDVHPRSHEKLTLRSDVLNVDGSLIYIL